MKISKILIFFGLILPVIFWLPVLGFLLYKQDYFTLIFVGLGGIVLRAVCEIIYFFYKEQRPYQKMGITPPHSWWLASPYKQRHDSFPSAHSAVMFYGSFFLISSHYYYLGAGAFLAAFLTVYGRVKLFYHYKMDVWAGAALASLWLIFMLFVARI
jgi:membrane-associated phospholipid phosphatase